MDFYPIVTIVTCFSSINADNQHTQVTLNSLLGRRDCLKQILSRQVDLLKLCRFFKTGSLPSKFYTSLHCHSYIVLTLVFFSTSLISTKNKNTKFNHLVNSIVIQRETRLNKASN